MLLRPFEETGTELLVALCNQIALMSQIEMNREKLIKEQVCASVTASRCFLPDCEYLDCVLGLGAAAPDRVAQI